MARSKIFISYRRADSAAMCDRIYARLVEVFGRDAIFKDIDAIPLGVNFETYIQQAMSESAVALALIGRSWLNIQGTDGRRRLDDPADSVRREIEEALKSGIPVIPLILDRAELPSTAELPETLRDLVKQNGLPVNVDPYFDFDMQRLARAIEQWVPSATTRERMEMERQAAEQVERARIAARQAEQARLAAQQAAAARPAAGAEPAYLPYPPTTTSPRPGVPVFGVVAALSGLLVVGLLVALANGTIRLPQFGGGGVTGVVSGKNCNHVAFLLPESATAARWEAADHPLVEAAIRSYLPGVTIDVTNAQSDATTQQTQAESELAKGACILVVAAVDSTAAAAIVAKAKASRVPVIAYDRLIQSDDLAYYVSFDGVDVGKKQGQYIADHYRDYVTPGHNNVVMINGSDTDPSTQLFGKGVHQILDPLYASGALRLVYEQATPGWENDKAQTEMEGALSQARNDVQIAYVMNDGMANTVIAALRAQGLNRKVLVTGQDAEVSGIHNILLGDQAMTVYKPIKTLADATGKLVGLISAGGDTSSLANSTFANSNGKNIPSILNPGTIVDISNIKSTVIADGYVTKADVCAGVPSGAGGVC